MVISEQAYEFKLEVGKTIQQVFIVYAKHARVLLPLAFLPFLLVAISSGILEGRYALSPIAIAISFVAGTLYQGILVDVVQSYENGEEVPAVRKLLKATVPIIGPLIGAGVIMGLAIGIGLLLALVPGLFLLTIWAVVAPVIVVERVKVESAFGRSRALVHGNGWEVFGVVCAALLMTVAIGIVFDAAGSALSDELAWRILVNALGATLGAPIAALAGVILYFRLTQAR